MELASWRDFALVWLAFLCFIGLIIPLAVSIFAVKGMHAAVDRTPHLLRKVQGYTRAARTKVDDASTQVAEPVIQAHKKSSHIAAVLDRIFHRRKANG